jgi:hypothetical protein
MRTLGTVDERAIISGVDLRLWKRISYYIEMRAIILGRLAYLN